MDTLVRQARKHNKDAFCQLIKLHTPSMYKVAKAILKNDEDAADAIQETALTCWEKIETLKKDKYFKTWLIRILINNCNLIYRQRSRMISEVVLPEEGQTEENYSASASQSLTLQLCPVCDSDFDAMGERANLRLSALS